MIYMAGEFDCLVKFIIIGDSGTGKTCLLRQFLDSKFPRTSTHTLGVEFGCKKLTIGDKKVKIQIWDTAGQERFRSVTRSYYRGSAAALVVYDVTRPETFSHVKDWLADARGLASPGIAIAVVGNKADLKSERGVTREEAEVFGKEHHVPVTETSALTGQNVENVFTTLAETVLQQISVGALNGTLLRPQAEQTSRGGCSC